MADRSPIERKAKKLDSRDWTEVRASWLRYVSPDGYPEGAELTELPDLPGLRDETLLVEDSEPGRRPMLEGLPPLVLGEAITLLHKATHVLGGAQAHVGVGMCSWSTASAYQAALFGAHAVLRLLRVATVQFDAAHYLLDLWPEPDKKRTNRGDQLLILKLPGPRLEHRPVWTFFQRLLRTTTVPDGIWPTQLVAELRELDCAEFARQRNHLHYRLSAWPLSDLRQTQKIPGYGAMTSLLSGCLNPDLDDFSVRLGVAILRLASGLLKDLAEASPKLGPEAASVRQWMEGEHYTVYRAAAF